MTTASAEPLPGRRLRANPGYELILLDRLAPAERGLVEQDAGGDERLYGVLRPRRGSGLDARTVDADTALLFLTLAEPAPLPRYARALAGEESGGVLARLVLDDVLQLEHDGTFLGGAAAAPLLLPAARSRGGSGRVGELSEAALRYGQELTDLPRELLARRLYDYGTLPASPALRARLADEAALARACGVGDDGPAVAALRAGWHEPPEPDSADGRNVHWRQWWARSATAGPSPERPACKLYVSPGLSALPDAVTAVAETLSGPRGALSFKVGRNLHGLCRPDKLVVYFERLDDLRAGAERLRERLGGAPAQGVPFTAAITGDGLLSWGSDPPSLPSSGLTSWRMWVVQRLADLLADGARADDATVEPWRFALDRLRLSGVDTDSWVPAAGMWPTALAS